MVYKYPLWKYVVCVLLCVLGLLGCVKPTNQKNNKTDNIRADYQSLLALFPEDNQGLGVERIFSAVKYQPMTYGLVLSSEAAHFRNNPNDESRRRIRKAVRWLVDNNDLDKDGLPGWGVPDVWDAFSDGSINPANHPYTITTAIVLNGFLDGLSISMIWSEGERDQIRKLIAAVVLRWSRSLWSQGYEGGYFWYSPNPADDIFGINAPAMFLGSMARCLHEQADIFTPEERRFVQERTDDLAKAIVSTVELRKGAPYWQYVPLPNKLNRQGGNDLVHQIYILWGVEVYRDCGGSVKLPFSRIAAIESVERFWKQGKVYDYPQDIACDKNQQAQLWGMGMMLGFYAKWGDQQQTERTYRVIKEAYGPWPKLRYLPKEIYDKDTFYHRHGAHVLMGLALYAFPSP
jgi:hypothetical protein